jgi:hypothetical protein
MRVKKRNFPSFQTVSEFYAQPFGKGIIEHGVFLQRGRATLGDAPHLI